MFWVNLLTVAISGLFFTFLDRKTNFAGKIKSKIKIEKPIFKVLFFLAFAIIIGVLSGLTGRAVFHFSENELLADIFGWIFIGVGIAFWCAKPSVGSSDLPKNNN